MAQRGINKGRVLVVGAGVIGLTTALTLAEHGYRVTVLAREFCACDNKSKLTSQVAAAFWNVITLPGSDNKTIQDWCFHGYSKFWKLAENSQNTGIYFRERVYLYTHMIDSKSSSNTFKEILTKHTRGFRHDKNLLQEKGVSLKCGARDAMSTQVPIIDTDIFMYWLTQQCILQGVDFIQGTVDSLLENCDSLRRAHQADCIVNCTGLAARKLVQDHRVYPMLGVSLTLHREDIPINLPNYSLTMTENAWHEGKAHGTAFITPRGDHSLWLGTMELESYDKNIGLTHPAVQRMLQECQAVYPPLKNINQEDLRVTVGVRPVRRGGPRVERDTRYPFLIHNYGHGSFGVNVSWGCASSVLRIMETKSSKFLSKL